MDRSRQDALRRVVDGKVARRPRSTAGAGVEDGRIPGQDRQIALGLSADRVRQAGEGLDRDRAAKGVAGLEPIEAVLSTELGFAIVPQDRPHCASLGAPRLTSGTEKWLPVREVRGAERQ